MKSEKRGAPKKKGELKTSITYSGLRSVNDKIVKKYGSVYKAILRLIEIDK